MTPGRPGGAADAALDRAAEETAARLGRRGVRLSGRETNEQLVDILDAVERFESAAERAGADLLVDEPLPGASVPLEPDDPTFVLPVRGANEAVADFVARIAAATAGAGRVRRTPARARHGA